MGNSTNVVSCEFLGLEVRKVEASDLRHVALSSRLVGFAVQAVGSLKKGKDMIFAQAMSVLSSLHL